MLNPTFIQQLTSQISHVSVILSDPVAPEFQELLLRWSDIEKKTPGAIVVAGTEEDIVTIVKLAVASKIPFVPSGGGHSLWSTIGSEGFILDLRKLKKITVDSEALKITVQAGVLVKEANDMAWEHSICTPLGTANSAGVIAMALGGGLSCFSGLFGFTSDNILSANLVTSTGELIKVSSYSNPELLYALRGAGQFMGVVTELTLKAYPKSMLGTSDGTVWTGAMIFPSSKAKHVLQTISSIVEDTTAPTMGICIITAPPPTFSTSLVVIPVFFGDATTAETFYAPLLNLEPFSTCTSTPYTRINDSGDVFCVKGGYKRFSGAGLRSISTDTWMEVLEKFEQLKSRCPDAATSGFAVEWNVYVPRKELRFEETSFSHRDVKIWAELLSWYTEPSSHEIVLLAENEVIRHVRKDQKPEEYTSYQNWTRDEPVEYLYRGTDRLERLKALKRKWDPNGIFTRIFL